MIVRVDEQEELHMQSISGDAKNWTIVKLTDTDAYGSFCGKNDLGIYTCQINKRNHDWRMAIGDLIDYAGKEEKHIALVMPESDYESVLKCYIGHTCRDLFLRKNERRVLVHSTSLENWRSICQDGHLKSWNRKKERLDESFPIGHLLGDPEEFRDYIMLGYGVACELVISSRQKGRIVMDVDDIYLSGVRLYFDAKRLAENGLLVRDGIHMKVKDVLPLKPYLIWAATWENVGLPSRVSTPKVFSELADSEFERRLEGATGVFADC